MKLVKLPTGGAESISVSVKEFLDFADIRLNRTAPVPVQVWQVPLEATTAEMATLAACLTPAEREWAEQFRFPWDKRRFLVRRGVLRHLLAASLGASCQMPPIVKGRFGKPVVADPQNLPLKFNVSHSGDWALIAISMGLELGVDLEQHREMADTDEIVSAHFSQNEIEEMAALNSAEKTAGFFNCWTRKEAFLKAIGAGLAFPLNRFSVNLSPGLPARLLEIDGNSLLAEQWSISALDLFPHYSAALAYPAGPVRISYHQFSLAALPDSMPPTVSIRS